MPSRRAVALPGWREAEKAWDDVRRLAGLHLRMARLKGDRSLERRANALLAESAAQMRQLHDRYAAGIPEEILRPARRTARARRVRAGTEFRPGIQGGHTV
jgi:hypothetical protein